MPNIKVGYGTVFTSELARLIEQWPEVKAVSSYVDDFFLILRRGTDQSFITRIASYLGTMGALVNPDKCQFGEVVTFVGFEVRGSEAGLEISMRDVKAQRLVTEVEVMATLARHDRQGQLEPALEKVAGRLQWYWPALANSYAYMEPIHHWRRRLTGGNQAVEARKAAALREALHQAMTWWAARVRQSRGRWTVINTVDYTEVAVVDASGPHAGGGYSVGGVLWRRESGGWEAVDVWRGVRGSSAESTQEAELVAIMQAWQRMKTGAGLVVSDSTAAVTAAARGYTRAYGSEMNSELRRALEGESLRHVVWTPRSLNTVADLLSRPQVNG